MKKILITLLATLAISAQTTLNAPVAVDYRYNLYWADPNPAGLVTSWMVYATNTARIHSATSRVTTISILSLLNGLPAATYTLYTTAISSTGAEGDPGDMLLVNWPGGNGKLHGGRNISVVK